MPAKEHHWPCESCGADLSFAPGQDQLTCKHCGHVQPVPEGAASDRKRALGELDLAAALRNEVPDSAMEETRATPCPGCGALVEFDGADHAMRCPFCATPVVTGTGQTRQIKPQAVIPFRIEEAAAREAMGNWLGRLWFAPNGLMEYARKGRRLSGLYVPYWTFDAATQSRYAGQRGTYYYESRTVTVKLQGKRRTRQERIRKIRWQNVSGRVARAFDDVLILASNSLPRNYTDGLQPWDLGDLRPYSPDYLAGFTAEGYTVTLANGHDSARETMAHVITDDVRRDIGGDEQKIASIETAFDDETFKHILLPIWMAAYRYNGRSYRFVVNGQTGKVQGERPWSIWKIAFALLALAAILAALALGSEIR